jgi:hypothetical protein
VRGGAKIEVEEIAEPAPSPPAAPAPEPPGSAAAELRPGDEATEPAPKPKDAKDRDRDRDRDRLSGPIRAIANAEDQSLKDWLDIIGTQGAFKVQLNRVKPSTIVVNGKTIDTAGYLETYDTTFTDDDIKRDWGGGTYTLKVTRKAADGSYKYERGLHRTIVIAGDPKVERLPGNAQAPTATAAPAGENPSIVKAAFEVMQHQLERANAAPPRGIEPAVQLLLEQMRRDAERRDTELAELRAELRAAANQKPPEDTVQARMLDKLIDGDSARITALRAQHASELEQLRESHRNEIRMINDRFDRDREAQAQAHQRMLDTIKNSYEREIAAMKSLGDVTTTSTKGSFDLQVHTLNAENKRLERDNDELRRDVRELRDKKDKSLMEQLKEIEALKDALGSGDEDKATSAWEKVAATVMNPAAIEQIGKIFQRPIPPQVQQAQIVAAQQAQARAQRPQIVRDARTGQKFAQVATPQGTQLVPVKKVLPRVSRPDGKQVEIPEVEPSTLAMLVSFLERSYVNNTEPVVVAQSGRSQVPGNILTWIRDNDEGGVSGVDLFLDKVAKLPGTSPLRTQRGLNWLRKVSKALTGDEEPTETETAPEPETPPTT